MRIDKCDSCGKIFDRKKDVYYSISDISFHVPGEGLTRMVTDKSPESESKTTHIESWVNYCDLDFCEKCWETLDIKKYIK